MRNFRNAAITMTAVTAVIFGFASSASACSSGFLADLGCRAGIISQQQANALDAAHAAAGRPLDHIANYAAGAAVNYVAPGAGIYVTQGLELRDQFNRSGLMDANPGAPMPQPYVDASQQMQPAVAVSNICSTPSGRYAGPLNAVGAYCQAMTPWGPQMGQVTF